MKSGMNGLKLAVAICVVAATATAMAQGQVGAASAAGLAVVAGLETTRHFSWAWSLCKKN